MHESIDVQELICDPAARRLWMLYKAAMFLPLGDALELARAAEVFVSGSRSENRTAEASGDAIQPDDAMQPDLQSHIVAQSAARASAGSEAAAHSSIPRPNRHDLSEDHRDRLLTRLAQGAKNAELALEFGLSPKQVQGFRIGSAREIARRRTDPRNAFEGEHEAAPTALIDDIVRYLRQRDDVVVLQEDGEYLVNGRFRMTASELVTRANRMRTRQRKPAFEVANAALSSSAPAANSHPLFWKDPSANEPLVGNGLRKAEWREPDVQLIRADHAQHIRSYKVHFFSVAGSWFLLEWDFVCTTFTADENAALIALLVGTIERHPFPQSQQVQQLRSILEKVRPRPKLLFDQEIEQNRFEDLVDE